MAMESQSMASFPKKSTLYVCLLNKEDFGQLCVYISTTETNLLNRYTKHGFEWRDPNHIWPKSARTNQSSAKHYNIIIIQARVQCFVRRVGWPHLLTWSASSLPSPLPPPPPKKQTLYMYYFPIPKLMASGPPSTIHAPILKKKRTERVQISVWNTGVSMPYLHVFTAGQPWSADCLISLLNVGSWEAQTLLQFLAISTHSFVSYRKCI